MAKPKKRIKNKAISPKGKKKKSNTKKIILAVALSLFIITKKDVINNALHEVKDFFQPNGMDYSCVIYDKDKSIDQSSISFGMDGESVSTNQSGSNCYGFLNANETNQDKFIQDFKNGIFSNNLFNHVIIDTGIGIDINGRLTKGQSIPSKLIEYLKGKNVEVSLMVTNFSYVGWDKATKATQTMLEKNSTKYIKDLTAYIGKNNITFDFENIPQLIGKDFTKFYESLCKEVRNKKLKIGVCLPPDKNNINGFDDKKIMSISDYGLYMFYDFNPSKPGALAPSSWVLDNLSDLKQKLSQKDWSKVVPVFGAYGYEYKNGKIVKAISYNNICDIKNDKENLNIKESYDEKSQTGFLSYTRGKDKYEVYFETLKSINAKVNFAMEKGISQFGVWTCNNIDKEFSNGLNKTLTEKSEVAQKTNEKKKTIEAQDVAFNEKDLKGLQLAKGALDSVNGLISKTEILSKE